MSTIDFTLQAWHIYTALGFVSCLVLFGLLRAKLRRACEADRIAKEARQHDLRQYERREKEQARIDKQQEEEQTKADLGVWWDVFQDFRAAKSQSARVAHLRRLVKSLDRYNPSCRTLPPRGLSHFAIETGSESTNGKEWRREITEILEPFVEVDISKLLRPKAVSDKKNPAGDEVRSDAFGSALFAVDVICHRRSARFDIHQLYRTFIKSVGHDSDCVCENCNKIFDLAKAGQAVAKHQPEIHERIARKGEASHCEVCHVVLLRGEGQVCNHCDSSRHGTSCTWPIGKEPSHPKSRRRDEPSDM